MFYITRTIREQNGAHDVFTSPIYGTLFEMRYARRLLSRRGPQPRLGLVDAGESSENQNVAAAGIRLAGSGCSRVQPVRGQGKNRLASVTLEPVKTLTY